MILASSHMLTKCSVLSASTDRHHCLTCPFLLQRCQSLRLHTVMSGVKTDTQQSYSPGCGIFCHNQSSLCPIQVAPRICKSRCTVLLALVQALRPCRKNRTVSLAQSLLYWCIWHKDHKSVSLQAWSGPEGSRKLRFLDFTAAQDGRKVVSLKHRPPLPPGNTPGNHFCYRLSRPQGHSATGRIMSLKNSNDTIGNQTCDLPVCSIVP